MDHEEQYRDREKLAQALGNDPLEKTKRDLVKEFGMTEETISEWTDSVQREIEEAIAFAEASPFPSPESLYQDVYGD